MTRWSVSTVLGVGADVAPAAPPETPVGPTGKERSASLWADARRQLIRRPTAIIPGIWLLLVGSMAVFPWLWTSEDPTDCDVARTRQAPSAEHIFGYDILGCDYYSHAIYGARPSLTIAVGATVGIVVVGGLLGPAGRLLRRLGRHASSPGSSTSSSSLPFLLGAIVFLTVLKKQNIWTITAILIILGWTTVARIMRGNVIASKNLDYVHAAQAMGASNWRHHVPAHPAERGRPDGGVRHHRARRRSSRGGDADLPRRRAASRRRSPGAS